MIRNAEKTIYNYFFRIKFSCTYQYTHIQDVYMKLPLGIIQMIRRSLIGNPLIAEYFYNKYTSFLDFQISLLVNSRLRDV